MDLNTTLSSDQNTGLEYLIIRLENMQSSNHDGIPKRQAVHEIVPVFSLI